VRVRKKRRPKLAKSVKESNKRPYRQTDEQTCQTHKTPRSTHHDSPNHARRMGVEGLWRVLDTGEFQVCRTPRPRLRRNARRTKVSDHTGSGDKIQTYGAVSPQSPSQLRSSGVSRNRQALTQVGCTHAFLVTMGWTEENNTQEKQKKKALRTKREQKEQNIHREREIDREGNGAVEEATGVVVKGVSHMCMLACCRLPVPIFSLYLPPPERPSRKHAPPHGGLNLR
jgi:hypothetical protein